MHSFPSHNNLSIEKRIHSGSKPQFAICKMCLWSATVFESGIKNNKNDKSDQDVVHICPLCSSSDISLITIANDIHN
jgi:hypothetical protein